MEGVRERVLCDTEYPWKSLQDLRKVNNNKQTNNKETYKQQKCLLKDVLYNYFLLLIIQPSILTENNKTVNKRFVCVKSSIFTSAIADVQ